MTTQLSRIRWWRLTWTALIVYAASFIIVFLVVTAYASYLAFQARGAPDQAMIEAFANRYAPWLGSITLLLFTVLGARWLARAAQTGVQLHGVALGVFVALVNLLLEGAGAFSWNALLTTILVIAAGWLGGRLAAGS